MFFNIIFSNSPWLNVKESYLLSIIILASGCTRNTNPCWTWEDPVGYSLDTKFNRIGSREYPLYFIQVQLGFIFCVGTHRSITILSDTILQALIDLILNWFFFFHRILFLFAGSHQSESYYSYWLKILQHMHACIFLISFILPFLSRLNILLNHLYSPMTICYES